jgi:hypothetical protein
LRTNAGTWRCLLIGVAMDLELEDRFHFIGASRARLETEGSISGFKRTGVAAQFGKDGEETLLDPSFRHALIDGMHDWAETERALESVIDFHRLPEL